MSSAPNNVTHVCPSCGDTFVRPAWRKSRYCSRVCNLKANGGGTGNGKGHGLSRTRLYKIWSDMKKRCYNSKCKGYRIYGAVGIRVCDEWRNDFTAFRDWAMSSGYSDSLEIDRRNPRGNYEPHNCRWATSQEQARNIGKRFRGGCASSRFKGVTKAKSKSGWVAQGGGRYLGTFATEIEAALAYDDAARGAHGEFACVNFPDRTEASCLG